MAPYQLPSAYIRSTTLHVNHDAVLGAMAEGKTPPGVQVVYQPRAAFSITVSDKSQEREAATPEA